MKIIKNEDGYLVQSSSKPDKFYTIPTDLKTCSCPAFRYFTKGKPCKHIHAITSQIIKDRPKQTTEIINGSSAVDFVNNYGEDELKHLKLLGEVFEKNGKLYKI